MKQSNKIDYKKVLEAWMDVKPVRGGKTYWLAIRNAIMKQIPVKTIIKTNDKEVRIDGLVFKKRTEVHYCPNCSQAVTGSDIYCRNCGQALIW